MKNILCALFLSVLITPHLCTAQVDISSGVNIAFPELFTGSKIINSGQLSSGIHLAAAWRAEDLKFFPGIHVSYGATRLPLQNAGNNVAALDLRYLSFMLNEYFVPDYGELRWLFYGGIGGTYMKSKGAAPSGNDTRQTSIDSTTNITHLFPAINIGMEYTAFSGENWHTSFGLCIRYNLLFSGKNDYYITVSEPGNKIYEYATTLTGNLVTPAVYVSAHYNIHTKK